MEIRQEILARQFMSFITDRHVAEYQLTYQLIT